MIYGVSSGRQLHFRINQYREAGNIKNFISMIIQDCKSNEEINEKIELSLIFKDTGLIFSFLVF